MIDDVRVSACADPDAGRREFVRKFYPNVAVTDDYHMILREESVDAVVVATPASTHAAIVKECLEYDKDVLCEKPLTLHLQEAEVLVKLAEKRQRILMVGHTFLFNAGIRKLKDYISVGYFGKIHYMHSVRTSLGPIRNDSNAVWDLAAHDVSIYSFLLECQPISVTARGEKYLRETIEDVAFVSITFPPNILASIHLSWIYPQKIRTLTIVGDKRMATWDDLNNLEPIKIYDKGVYQEPFYQSYGEFQFLLREGDILIPKIDLYEPLRLQSQHFVDCVVRRETPVSDGRFGLDVVKVLAAIQKSMDSGGTPQGI